MALQEFITAIKSRGLARTNLYGVNVTLPRFLAPYQNFTSRTLGLYAARVPVPDLALTTRPYQNFGEVRTLPGNRTFSPVAVDFYMDGDFDARLVFEQWINLISDPETKTQSFYDDFIGIIEIYGLSRTGDTLCTYRLNEAYPYSVGQPSFSHDNPNFLTANVGFVFKNANFVSSAPLDAFAGYDTQTGRLNGLPSYLIPYVQMAGNLGGQVGQNAFQVLAGGGSPLTLLNLSNVPLGNQAAVINSFSALIPTSPLAS